MKHTLRVPEESPRQRADVFVASQLPELSRSFWNKQFELGRITLDGAAVKPARPVEHGDVLEVLLPDVSIEAVELPIIYEDADVLVINKPAGILTHAKGPISDEFTVADFIRPRTTDGLDTNRPGIVHRLDRDTSGVLIAAKNNEAKRWLQRQFALRKAKKSYIALVVGKVEPPEATLRLPIERNPKAPQTFRVGAGGKDAETHYKVAEQLPRHTLVSLQPHTGRTHQLRVHMHYLRHPIVGDRLYGKPDKLLANRLFLHAEKLEITLPNRERRIFSAPLTPELTSYLEKVR